MNKNTANWLHGLFAAFIGGSSGMMEVSLGVLIIAPEKFDIGPILWKTLLTIFVLGTITGAKVMFAYLKQSPLPTESVEIIATQTTTVTATPTDEKKG